MSELSACAAAREALDDLVDFVHRERARAGDRVVSIAIERDERFIREAGDALSTCDEHAIARLLEEMRGLSHYFASYALNMREVDRLADRLYRCVQGVLLAQRATRQMK